MLRKSVTMAALSCLCILAQSDRPELKPVKWGKQSGPFQLAIMSDKEVYRTGESVQISAVLKNVAGHPAWHESSRTFYSMDVRFPVPEWIPGRPQAKLREEGERAMHPLIGDAVGFTLSPGHTVTTVFEMGRLYDMSTPGKYQVIFSCKEPPEVPGGPVLIVVSNEITVTILPK